MTSLWLIAYPVSTITHTHMHTHTRAHTHTHTQSVVLVDLLKSELGHLQSLETLVQVYLPAFEDEHVPTFLQGRRNAIFSNVKEIFEFQRYVPHDLSVVLATMKLL